MGFARVQPQECIRKFFFCVLSLDPPMFIHAGTIQMSFDQFMRNIVPETTREVAAAEQSPCAASTPESIVRHAQGELKTLD